jgi:cytochrome c peroxidase
VPKSPHAFDERARAGERVFVSEGCGKCHSGEHYTNNELMPVAGFAPAYDAASIAPLSVMDRTIDTDPGLALRTRKGTGFYKVPSLRGLWYRDLLEHSGSVRTLEDWFDARRLQADYVPTGWRGPGVTQRAVPGHEFGLDLPADEKASLIAFLRTL